MIKSKMKLIPFFEVYLKNDEFDEQDFKDTIIKLKGVMKVTHCL